MNRIKPTLHPLQFDSKLTVREALERVLRLPSVASKRYLTNKVSSTILYRFLPLNILPIIISYYFIAQLSTLCDRLSTIIPHFFLLEILDQISCVSGPHSPPTTLPKRNACNEIVIIVTWGLGKDDAENDHETVFPSPLRHCSISVLPNLTSKK